MEQFGRWFDLTETSVEEHAPDGPAALQVRRARGLVDYPTGKSAMVWYGYAATSARSVLKSVFADELQTTDEYRGQRGGSRDADQGVGEVPEALWQPSDSQPMIAELAA